MKKIIGRSFLIYQYRRRFLMSFQEIYRGMENGAEAINQNFKNAIGSSGNQTILGTKDFADGALSKGNAVLTQNGLKYKSFTSTDLDSLQGGSVTFERYGDIVNVQFTIQTRADRDFAKDQTIVWGIPAEFRPNTDKLFPLINSVGSGGIVKFVNGASISAQTTIAKNTWYWGTITYIAKNRL